MALTRDELVSRIESLGRAESQPRARALARDLEPHVATLDTELRQKLGAALESVGLDPGLARAPVSLGVGESWLLLHAGGRDGHVARLVAERRPQADRDRTPSSAAATYVTDAGVAAPLHALATVAARACRALPSDLRHAVGLRIASSHGPGFAMVGSSFQLSAAVALASHALGRPPVSTCAGTARVGLDGTLGAVTHLAEKVAGLRLDFPEICTVVVAEGQEVSPVEGIGFVHVRTLGEALPVFGIEIRGLGPSLLEDHLTRAASFDQKNKRSLTPDEWRELSLEAWESCIALEEQEAQVSARCRAWAALFAVHAGDEQHARLIVAGANRTLLEENPGLAAWLAVVTASAGIDRDEFDAAVREARVAVDKSAALQGGERTAIRGRALGTLGRALMHAGKLAEAEAPLRDAADAHRPYPGAELPQSLCYVATCLRLASRVDEALSVIDEALAANTELMKTRDAARTTEHYLLMERGRTLIALGRYDDAERDLLAVAPRALPASYPRLGAERSLVRLRVATGAHAGAREGFLRCVEAARSMLSSERGLTLGRVAAVGIAEGILGLTLAPAEIEDAHALWRKAFEKAASADEIRNVLAMWIY